jgi:2-amino-4-hydroxy-6-hydroxymethyldihydropteridine diphosphokinase
MTKVYISVGSNIDPIVSIREGLTALQQRYGQLALSPVYESEAVGFSGDNFYNLIIAFDTTESVEEVATYLRQVEKENGRVRTGEKFNSRTLDLDLVLYGELILKNEHYDIPRDEIFKYAFVLLPLADLYPTGKHPETGDTYAKLWENFDQASQPLWVVDVDLLPN